MTKRAQRTSALPFVLMLVLAVWAGGRTLVAGQLAPADAKTWIGDWVLTVEGRRGPQEQALSIKEAGGKVVAQLAGGRGGPTDITDISKSGNDLVLKFQRNFQGNAVDVVLTLSPQADGTLKVTQVNGQGTSAGTGKKKG